MKKLFFLALLFALYPFTLLLASDSQLATYECKSTAIIHEQIGDDPTDFTTRLESIDIGKIGYEHSDGAIGLKQFEHTILGEKFKFAVQASNSRSYGDENFHNNIDYSMSQPKKLGVSVKMFDESHAKIRLSFNDHFVIKESFILYFRIDCVLVKSHARYSRTISPRKLA